MKPEFSPEEINEIVRAARVWAPGFTQEQLQELVNSQHHLADSEFCEATWGMVRQQQEKGIPYTQALDRYEQLLQDNAELEQKAAGLQEKLAALEGKVRQAQDRLQQLEEATEQAKAERERVEKELVAFKKKTEKEKRRIDRDLEQCRQEANVSKEEITASGELKEQLASRGFAIEFTLDLCQEFVGHENAREELAKVLKEHQTLTNYIAASNE